VADYIDPSVPVTRGVYGHPFATMLPSSVPRSARGWQPQSLIGDRQIDDGAIVVPKILTERVESLEKAVESLRELPVRVTPLEEQVLQLRSEMRDGFSAVLQVIDASSAATQRLIDDTRAEGKQEFAAVRAGTRRDLAAVRNETKQEFTAVRAEMAQGFAIVGAGMAREFVAVRAEMAEGFAAVRTEMTQGLGEVRTEMRVLHEDLTHLLFEHAT
jgi:hypothetical protein